MEGAAGGRRVIRSGAANAGCDGGGAANNDYRQDKTIINRIMLRFRPIAPKPTDGGSDSGSSAIDDKNQLASGKRRKRRYVRVCKRNNIKRNNKAAEPPDQQERSERPQDDGAANLEKVVTLQLLPESSELKGSPERNGSSWCNNLHLAVDDNTKEYRYVDHDQENRNQSMWFKLKQPLIHGFDGQQHQTVAMLRENKKTLVESWVIVEDVTDIYSTCMDGRGLQGSTDVEIMRNLDGDTCPGFISDCSNSVQWLNKAYKRMVVMAMKKDINYEGQQLYNTPEITVWLVIKEKLLPFLYCASAFSCWVRLQYYSCGKDKCSQMVPCDGWRMDCGGFAWRLDVEAALSLGR